jgi:hypothetical protein
LKRGGAMSARNTGSAALHRAQLNKSFSDVSVGLKLLGGPMNPGNPSIFQMNIHRSARFGEYFQIWPGDRNNEIEVLAVDRLFVQLVLRVKEPRRRFVEIVTKNSWTRAEAVEAHARSSGGRILEETRYDWRLELWTPSVDRRYLCGRDDLHLFIAQVPECNTVAEAHESLKPDVVRRAEALSPGGVQRQGEWFFVAPSGEESERLTGHLKERPGALLLRASLGKGSRPHVADFVVNIDRRTRTKHREYRRPEVYARGAVVHPDHRRLWLEDWRRVVRNQEIGGTGDGLRIRWID